MSGSSRQCSSANHAAGSPEAGLDLVDDEQRPVAPASGLRGQQVVGRRRRDHAPLHRLDDERGDVLLAQLALERVEVAERDARAAGQQRAEAFLEELIADDRQRSERHPVEARIAREQARPTGRGARELDRRVHSLRPCAGEEHGVEARRQALGELFREHAGQRRIVDLHAAWEARSRASPRAPPRTSGWL